jgi:hypothetical protein
MVKMNKCRWWRGLRLLAVLLLLVPIRGLAIQTTNVQGIVYRADGSLAQGTMLVSWPAFTAADGSTVAAGNTSATIAPDGSVSMALTPNVGANPEGTYYTVVYHMDDGTVEKEYWVVPQAATATISEMRARVVPAAVAQQSVSQQYVDTSISALQGSYLQLKGGTMSGVLNLSTDPTDAMQAATKAYVDAHAGSQLPQAQNLIAGSGDGGAVSMMEKGVTVTGTHGKVAWDDDLNAGVYDPRDPRFAGGIYGPTPAAAAQAMSNQMACDLAMGVVKHATAKWPQGTFYGDNLLIAPGSSWQGVATSAGGTRLRSQYNNHPLVQAPVSMTVTCSDGQSHTDNLNQTHVSHFTFVGCATGGCVNAPGDSGSYGVGGPANTGLRMSSTGGVVEWIYAQAFGGYGIRVDGQDTKAFHDTVYSNDMWYYYGGYKGAGESASGPEVSATTTGTTGSVALSWTAAPGATGYVVYRGTSAGGESVFYKTATNAFTDTGAVAASGRVTNVVNTTVATPETATATPSTTGGTLAAGTYYYKVTSLGTDTSSLGSGWHGSIEFSGADVMADWIEAYGLQDAPTVYTYHHLADVLSGGGYSHFDHLWPQLGQVGIAQPYGFGVGDTFENIRIDFARLEGFWTTDIRLRVMGGNITSSCIAANAVTLNTGQDGSTPAGICNQFFSNNGAVSLSDMTFNYVAGFGPTYETADIYLGGANSTYHNILGGTPLFQYIPAEGIHSGTNWEPQVPIFQFITGPAPNMQGLYKVNPNDSKPTTYTGFMNVQTSQEFYIYGGNANVTIQNNTYTHTCSGRDINMGSITGVLHFHYIFAGAFGLPAGVAEDCDPRPAQPTLSSSETVAFSATLTFATTTRASMITLAGNVTSFTLAAGADGQEKTLEFCQNATGGYTVAAPANVHGFFTVGANANKCSSQHFTYSTAQAAWLADSPGVVNE